MQDCGQNHKYQLAHKYSESSLQSDKFNESSQRLHMSATDKLRFTYLLSAALKFCKTCVAMKFVDDDDDDVCSGLFSVKGSMVIESLLLQC